jgi:hypothetical protein
MLSPIVLSVANKSFKLSVIMLNAWRNWETLDSVTPFKILKLFYKNLLCIFVF